jgi:hypothetical protein
MAPAYQVAAATPIYVGAYGAAFDHLSLLGYCRNMPEIEEHEFAENVQSDLYGGDSGPPADRQTFGFIAIVRLEISDFDQTVLSGIRARLEGLNTGAERIFDPTECGYLKFQGGYGYRLLLNAANDPINFPLVEFTEPIASNRGTQYERYLIVATAHVDRASPYHLYDQNVD